VNFDETIRKSYELDKVLASPLQNGAKMAEIGGKKLVGELGGIFDQIRKVVEEAKLGVAAAASELMVEAQGVKAIETAIRSETKAVRDFKAQVLGNALGGENQEGEQ
jgi:hypothetical protein